MSGGIYHSQEIIYADSEDPDQTPHHHAASDLDMLCLLMSKKNASLLWVNSCDTSLNLKKMSYPSDEIST